MADYKSTSIVGIDDIQDQGGNERLETILGTEIDTSTGATLYDITGIPNGIKEILFMLEGVSTNGTSGFMIQLGTSSGIQITNYIGRAVNGNVSASAVMSTGFLMLGGGTVQAARFYLASYRLNLENAASFKWHEQGHLTSESTTQSETSDGRVTLPSVLDRIRFTTIGGTNTFDAGVLNIQMRF